MEKTLYIKGMMCPHCEARVKKALEAVSGVQRADVSHVTGTAAVTADDAVPAEKLKKAVEDAGYTVTGLE